VSGGYVGIFFFNIFILQQSGPFSKYRIYWECPKNCEEKTHMKKELMSLPILKKAGVIGYI